MLVNWQQADALGIFMGFASNLIIFSIPAVKEISWRLQTATVLIPTVCLLLILYLVPGEHFSAPERRRIDEPNTQGQSHPVTL